MKDGKVLRCLECNLFKEESYHPYCALKKLERTYGDKN